MIKYDIKDKARVLAALYNNSKIQGMGFLHERQKPLTELEANEILESQTYFDYLYGKVMKIDLSKDSFDAWLYDRNNGLNAAVIALENNDIDFSIVDD